MTQSAIGELWHRTSILTAIAIVAMGWTLNVDAQNQAQKTATVGELGDVLARVNDKPILTKTLFPGAPAETKINQYQLRSRTEAAISDELVAQKAVALGLDKDPKYLEQVAVVALQVARQEKQMLARLYYGLSIPEIQAAIDSEGRTPTAEEIAAHIAENQDEFSGYPETAAERVAISQLTAGLHGATANALAEWLQQRLAAVSFQADGEDIPAAVIEQAVAQTIESRGVLLPKIRESAISRESQRSGVEPEVIEKDAALVTALLSKTVIEADGTKLVLGDLPELERLVTAFGQNRFVMPLVFMTIVDLIVAEDAREAGIDKDPRFIELQARLAQAVEKGRPKMLAEFYYARQGMSPDDMAASDEDVRSEYNFFMSTLKTRPTRNSADQQDAIRKHIELTRLKAVRAAHLEMLRKAAEIEYLIDVLE
jgi:hypothetical protein